MKVHLEVGINYWFLPCAFEGTAVIGKTTSKYVLYFALWGQDNIVSTVTTLWARQSRVQILAEGRDFFSLHNIQTKSGAQPA